MNPFFLIFAMWLIDPDHFTIPNMRAVLQTVALSVSQNA